MTTIVARGPGEAGLKLISESLSSIAGIMGLGLNRWCDFSSSVSEVSPSPPPPGATPPPARIGLKNADEALGPAEDTRPRLTLLL